MAKALGKGEKLEEMLRNYFLRNGYYVVRGVPFQYEGFDITDIDLWMYGRASSVSREIIIVDIKNKKTPQAIERIFWISGLKIAVKADGAIVATTDRRKEVKDFGSDLNVTVLDGSFLSKLEKSGYMNSSRLSDEELFQGIAEYSLEKLDGNWRGRVLESKAALVSGMSFDSCNLMLEHARFFAVQALEKQKQVTIACRCLYMISSFIVLSIDYFLKELSFLEDQEKASALTDGFTYGTRGKERTEKLLNLSLSLIEEYSSSGASIVHEAKKNFEGKISSLPSSILVEYFSKIEVGKSLFIVAKELEELAYLKEFKNHTGASTETRSAIGVFLDYWDIDRKTFSESIKAQEK